MLLKHGGRQVDAIARFIQGKQHKSKQAKLVQGGSKTENRLTRGKKSGEKTKLLNMSHQLSLNQSVIRSFSISFAIWLGLVSHYVCTEITQAW